MSVRHSIPSVLIAFSVAACSVASTPSLPLATPSVTTMEAPTATSSPTRTASPAPSARATTPAATTRPSATVSETAELEWGKPSRIADLWVDVAKLTRVPAGFVLLTPGTSNMWFSPDSRNWGSVDLGGLDIHIVSIAGVTQSGSRMVAVGAETFANADGSSASDALVLLSDDGRHWPQIANPRFKNAQMELVGSTRQGIVAFGWTSAYEPAIWTSPDGSSWIRATNESGLAVARGVTTLAERDGALLAFVGVGATEQRPTTNVEVWRTEGRAEWQRIGELPRSAGMTVNQAVYGNGRWYAFGWKRFETDKPVAWTSPDGATWTQVKVPEAWSMWGSLTLRASRVASSPWQRRGMPPGIRAVRACRMSASVGRRPMALRGTSCRRSRTRRSSRWRPQTTTSLASGMQQAAGRAAGGRRCPSRSPIHRQSRRSAPRHPRREVAGDSGFAADLSAPVPHPSARASARSRNPGTS